jgi:hypothetical protein
MAKPSPTLANAPPTLAVDTKTLVVALLLYTAASLVHFAHNAEHLADYPNLPAAFTPTRIYLAWIAIFALGAAGYVLYRRGRRRTGLAVLALYATLGFDGLLHYGRAPVGAHTAAMNLTIWLEVIAAAFLMSIVVVLTRAHLRPRRVW